MTIALYWLLFVVSVAIAVVSYQEGYATGWREGQDNLED